MNSQSIERVYGTAAAAPIGIVDIRNPLEGEAVASAARIETAAGSGVVIGWSGWLGEPASSVDGVVDADFRMWSGHGRRSLDEVVAAVMPLLEASGGRWWIRPHARHVLSDGPSCGAFLKAHAAACLAGRLGLVLDLDLVVTDAMRERRVEHVGRMLETLGPIAGLVAVVAGDGDQAVVGEMLGRDSAVMVWRRA